MERRILPELSEEAEAFLEKNWQFIAIFIAAINLFVVFFCFKFIF